ncbi:hypothetical protein V7S43_005536 [Phytophthora oleae]|uniref:Uncharacterized protein n=1 Tax=Phytophthora oleae TaxID=2107226 RepID=A0ABD3FQE2_9STRA
MSVLDREVTARDLDFRSVWQELRRQGWTRKSLSRRSHDDWYFYICPGRSTTGTEGVDFFRGEEVVLRYYAAELRKKAGVPVHTAATPSLEPGDAQLVAAVPVVRKTYAADIEAAEARALTIVAAQKLFMRLTILLLLFMSLPQLKLIQKLKSHMHIKIGERSLQRCKS